MTHVMFLVVIFYFNGPRDSGVIIKIDAVAEDGVNKKIFEVWR